VKTLAYDCTGPILTIALADKGDICARLEQPASRTSGNQLEVMIGRVLADCGWTRRDVEGIGLILGPGSLTATRIGWATAAGWAQASGIPVAGWSVPAAQRRWLAESGAFDAGHKSIFCLVRYRGETFCMYDLSGEPSNHPHPIQIGTWLPPVDSRPSLIVGPGAAQFRDTHAAQSLNGIRTVPDSESYIPGGMLALWTAQDITEGRTLPLADPPIDYGLPPDFRKLGEK